MQRKILFYLEGGNKAKRLNCAWKHRNWDAEKWQQELWTDGSSISQFAHWRDGGQYRMTYD